MSDRDYCKNQLDELMEFARLTVAETMERENTMPLKIFVRNHEGILTCDPPPEVSYDEKLEEFAKDVGYACCANAIVIAGESGTVAARRGLEQLAIWRDLGNVMLFGATPYDQSMKHFVITRYQNGEFSGFDREVTVKNFQECFEKPVLLFYASTGEWHERDLMKQQLDLEGVNIRRERQKAMAMCR